jgi:putative acetyltransferase
MEKPDFLKKAVLRSARQTDFDALGVLMFQAIRLGQSPYSDAQRAAWLSAPYCGLDWHAKLTAQHVMLAECREAIAGFMSLRPDGYLDLAFILPQARGGGLFRGLYNQIESHARDAGLPRVWTHASLMAQPAFAAVGFDLVQHEAVTRAGEQLPRAEMEKRL